MAVKKIILIRHGELQPEFSGRFVGSTDAPLGEHGIADCRALAGIWRAMKSEITFVSPKLRALQTAELICGSVPAVKDDAIREIDFGKWENLTFEEIAGANPEYSKYWYDHPDEIHFPEGESVQLFNLRVEAFTEMLLELPQNVITVISHGGVLTAMIRRLMDLPRPLCQIFGGDCRGLHHAVGGDGPYQLIAHMKMLLLFIVQIPLRSRRTAHVSAAFRQWKIQRSSSGFGGRPVMSPVRRT